MTMTQLTTNLIIIYLILMCWDLYTKCKVKILIKVINNKKLLLSIGVVFGFGFLWGCFFRLINLFRETKVIDLKKLDLIEFDFGFVVMVGLIVMLIYSLRRLVFFLLKLNWFKLHYFLIGKEDLVYLDPREENFFQRKKFYTRFYGNILYLYSHQWYFLFKLINYVLLAGLFLVLLVDLVFNSMVLDLVFKYLVYYSLYKLVYMCVVFIVLKSDAQCDYIKIKYLYIDEIYSTGERDFKICTKQESHKTEIYVKTVILEQDYKPRPVVIFTPEDLEMMNEKARKYFQELQDNDKFRNNE